MGNETVAIAKTANKATASGESSYGRILKLQFWANCFVLSQKSFPVGGRWQTNFRLNSKMPFVVLCLLEVLSLPRSLNYEILPTQF